MSDLATWLLVQLAADEQVARACTTEYGPWELEDDSGIVIDRRTGMYEVSAFPERGGSVIVAYTFQTDDGLGNARHIALWDPARVLADVAAKRRLIAYEDRWGEDDHALRLLALPYADRPGYQESWRPV